VSRSLRFREGSGFRLYVDVGKPDIYHLPFEDEIGPFLVILGMVNIIGFTWLS